MEKVKLSLQNQNTKEVKMNDNPYKGVNKFCAKCRGKCKQFKNVIVVRCPLFEETDENRKNRLFKKSSGDGFRHQN